MSDVDHTTARNETSRPRTPRCPICSGNVDPESGTYPFCSKRCRLVDLGQWMSEKYSVSRPVDDPDAHDDYDAH